MGPNDSGLSNMIGTLLFVFGYRASSTMRQCKLPELIHNPIQYLDLHECSGEVLLRAIIDLLRSFTRTSHSTSSSPHPTCILSSKTLADRGDGRRRSWVQRGRMCWRG